MVKGKPLGESIDARLCTLVFDDNMVEQVQKRIAGVDAMRRPAKIHRLSATLIVLLTFALAATAACALGLPQAFFSMLKGKTSDNDVNRYDKMDALTTPQIGTQDDTGIGIRCYYDGKQIKLMIVHGAAFTLCDGIMLKSGEDLPRSKENNGKNEDGSVWESIEIETPLPKAAQDRDSLDIVLELKPSGGAEGQTRKIEVTIERSDAMTITHLVEARLEDYAANLQVVMTPVNTLLYVTLEAPTNWDFSQKTEESWFKEDFVHGYVMYADGVRLNGRIDAWYGTNSMKGTYAPVPANAARIVLRPIYTQSGEHAGEDIAIDLK